MKGSPCPRGSPEQAAASPWAYPPPPNTAGTIPTQGHSACLRGGTLLWNSVLPSSLLPKDGVPGSLAGAAPLLNPSWLRNHMGMHPCRGCSCVFTPAMPGRHPCYRACLLPCHYLVRVRRLRLAGAQERHGLCS